MKVGINPMRRIVLLALAAIGLVRGGRGQRLYQRRHSRWHRGTLCGKPRFSRRSVGMYLGPSYCQTACTCAFNKVGAPTGCDENAKVSKEGRRGREQRRLARNRKYLFAWRAHGLTATSLEEVVSQDGKTYRGGHMRSALWACGVTDGCGRATKDGKGMSRGVAG